MSRRLPSMQGKTEDRWAHVRPQGFVPVYISQGARCRTINKRPLGGDGHVPGWMNRNRDVAVLSRHDCI